MNWYIARVLFQWHVENSMVPDMHDEQFILVQAASAENAYQKVSKQCQSEERTFQNVQNDWVNQQFLGFIDLDSVLSNEIESGTELYSILHKDLNAKEMLSPKEQLRAFRAERDKDKKVSEMLNSSDLPFVQK